MKTISTSEIDIASRKNSLIQAASRKGWVVAAEGDWGIQFYRPKIYKKVFLWTGAALILLGVGILVWILGYLEYLGRRDQVLLVPTKEMAADNLDSIYRRLNHPF